MRAHLTRISLSVVFGIAVSSYVVTLNAWIAAAFAIAVWLLLAEAEWLASDPSAFGLYNTLANVGVHGLWIAGLVSPMPDARLLVLGFAAIWYFAVTPLGFLLSIWLARRLAQRVVGQLASISEPAFRRYSNALTSILRMLVAMCLLHYGCSWMQTVFGAANGSVWLIPGAGLACLAAPLSGALELPQLRPGLTQGVGAIRAYNAGNRRYRAGDYKGAARAYTRAIQRAKRASNADLLNLHDMYFNRALAHAALLERKQASDDYEQAVNLNPHLALPQFRDRLEANIKAAQSNASREPSAFDRLVVGAIRAKQRHLFRYLLSIIAAGCFIAFLFKAPKAAGVGGWLAWLWQCAGLAIDIFGGVFLLGMTLICIWTAVSAIRIYRLAAFRNAIRTALAFRGAKLHRRLNIGLAIHLAVIAASSVAYQRFGWGLGFIALSLAGVLNWACMTFRPAAVLFLANSNDSAFRILAALRVARIEFRVVSLLDQDSASTPELKSWAETECFRTSVSVAVGIGASLSVSGGFVFGGVWLGGG